jgi:succinate dehydrogenase / fumarate reductase flavoprotein subunit
LGKALEVIQNINDLLPEIRVPDTQNLRQVLELSFMTDVATMVSKAAMARQESRGTHYRVDYPSRNNHRWLKVINFRRVAGQDRIFLTHPQRIADFYTEEKEEIYHG